MLKKILQPCEAHIPFILQFLMDFNLQGMNFIHLKKVFARRNPGKKQCSFIAKIVVKISCF